jgi:flagellar motor protein MotB
MNNSSTPSQLGATRNRRYRVRKAKREAMIAKEFKSVAAQLNLATPANITKIPRVSLKGTKRPVYNPPEHIMNSMTPEELTEWKAKERKRRKALMQKANREKKNAIMKKIQEQLPLLKRQVEEKKMMGGGTVSFDSTEAGCTKDQPQCISASEIGDGIQAVISSQQQHQPPKTQEQEVYKEDREVQTKPEAAQMNLDEIDLDFFDNLAPATVDDASVATTTKVVIETTKVEIEALMSDPIMDFDTESSSCTEDDAAVTEDQPDVPNFFDDEFEI